MTVATTWGSYSWLWQPCGTFIHDRGNHVGQLFMTVATMWGIYSWLLQPCGEFIHDSSFQTCFCYFSKLSWLVREASCFRLTYPLPKWWKMRHVTGVGFEAVTQGTTHPLQRDLSVLQPLLYLLLICQQCLEIKINKKPYYILVFFFVFPCL